MKKYLTILFLAFCVTEAVAQKRSDTLVYYIQNSGKVVSTRDSADYFMVILPPDTSVDKKLFLVNEYYSNGKPRLMAGSLTQNIDLKLQGPYISYFPNGHKMEIGNFENNRPTSDILEYYPNGRFYNKKTYKPIAKGETELLLEDCIDSTGKVLAENGNGRWIIFNNGFSKIIEDGKIVDGKPDSVWTIKDSDSTGTFVNYDKGTIVKNLPFLFSGSKYSVIDSLPMFPGGADSLLRFIAKRTRYPAVAAENGTQGRVVITFFIEKDGAVTDVKAVKGIGDGCEDEVVRVVKIFPQWAPAMKNGRRLRVKCAVSVNFIALRKTNNMILSGMVKAELLTENKK